MTRKCKHIYVSGNVILGCFRSPSGFVNRVTFPGLPEDVEVEHVFWDSMRAAWAITVSHPSFPEVPIGQMTEQIDAYTSVIQIPGVKPSDVCPDLIRPYNDPEEYKLWRERSYSALSAINRSKEPPN